MGKIAFLFAGQGAQYPGMGKDLCEQSSAAAEVFRIMEQEHPGVLEDCFYAPAERLAQTSVTQPCVYCVDLACAAALTQMGIRPEAVAGFSLGEVAALTFAGVFSLQTGAHLICHRGELMQAAAEENPGAMTAVMRLPDEKVEELCRMFENVWPVNYNCPGQIVAAGSADEISSFAAAVKENGGTAKALAVGGAFHTPFMERASSAFAEELKAIQLQNPVMPVYANLTAQPYSPPLADTLAAQISNPVRWHATIAQMQRDGFDTFIEAGPGKTLSGFVKRIIPDARVFHVEDIGTLDAAANALSA